MDSSRHHSDALVDQQNRRVSSRLVDSVPYSFPSLIDARFDQESCGVGFVAQLSGEPSHAILNHALTALARLEHRGAVAADGKSSDGVGVMTSIPRDLLLHLLGIKLDRDKNGGYWLLDIVRARANPGDIERLLLNIAEQDGKKVPHRVRPGSGAGW